MGPKCLMRRKIRVSPFSDETTLLGFRLEDGGLDAVALQELVELGAISPRQFRRLRHAAMRELEDAREVVALEALARVLERGELVHLDLDCLLDEGARNHIRRAQRHGL